MLAVPMVTTIRKKGTTAHRVTASRLIPHKFSAALWSKEFMWWSVKIMASLFHRDLHAGRPDAQLRAGLLAFVFQNHDGHAV